MQSLNNQPSLPACHLHIRLNNIQIRHNFPFQDIYFSFVHKEKLHFSSSISHKTSHINDDIFIPFENEDEIPDVIKVQRWENHMILLEHQIDISELKGRSFTKKKIQTKQNEIISLTFSLLYVDDVKFLNLPVNKILQHYLKISKIQVYDPNKHPQEDISYFEVQTRQQKYTLPIINSQVVLQLPVECRISYYKNNQMTAQSDWFESRQFNSKTLEVGLYNQKGSYYAKARLNLQWGTNLLFKKLQSSILYEAHELCVYDIEVKFDNFSQFSGAKLKFVYGTKAFQILGEFNHRVVQFQRIIYIILKSEDEEVSVYCQRNNKIVAEAKFSTTQMLSHKVIAVKKYFTDPVSHRPLGYVKFLCEKAKNLSLPASNTFWKEYNKKKHPSKLMLRIQQLSVESQSTKVLEAIVKTEKEQYKIYPLINFTYFQPDTQTHQPLLLTIQQKLSIYMLIRQRQEENSSESNQFLGISAINYEQLRLGSNPLKIQFYKNQQITVQANCIINKIVPYPFIKGNFQPEIPVSPHTKSLTILAEISRIEFEPYFYTFEYEQKNQVYCIFQIGKTKKVIVLEPSKSNRLSFEVTKSSDVLNFIVSETDFIKAKLTFLVSSLGKDEQVYGWSIVKLKVIDFLQNEMQKFQNMQIKNQHGIFIGCVSLQVKKCATNSSQLLSNKEIKKIKNEMMKVNENMEKMERNLSKNKHIFVDGLKTPVLERLNEGREKKELSVRYVSRKQYSPERIKLPKI